MLVIHEKEVDKSVIIPKEDWLLILNILKKTEEVKIYSYEPQKEFKGKGFFKKYANPDLINSEKDAWKNAAADKYENS